MIPLARQGQGDLAHPHLLVFILIVGLLSVKEGVDTD